MIGKIILLIVVGLYAVLSIKSYIDERRQREREMEYLIRLKERGKEDV